MLIRNIVLLARIIVFSICIIECVVTDLKSFDDSVLFRVHWKGPLDIKDDQVGDDETAERKPASLPNKESLFMMTADNEQYQCILPDNLASRTDEDSAKHYKGPSPLNLLKPLFLRTFCSYRLEQYWTYELCHGKSLRQYHEESMVNKVSVQEYYLGRFDANKFERDDAEYMKEYEARRLGATKKIPSVRLEGVEIPYFAVNMTGGTLCDINGHHRATMVLYVCSENAKNEIVSLDEMSTCEYQVIVLTPYLCSHPDFKINYSPENEISCHPKSGASVKPKGLSTIEREASEFRNGGITEPIIDQETDTKDKAAPLLPPPPPESQIPHDPKFVKAFLSGEHCLTGGSGWWKYEFCYGKRVEQFHEEKGKARASIMLGVWDKEQHLDWIKKHPEKRPGSNKVPRQVSHFYTDGAVCDLTGKPRVVEVKLKCKEAKGSLDTVTLYLIEPRACEYILGVESPVICPLLETADSDGFLYAKQP